MAENRAYLPGNYAGTSLGAGIRLCLCLCLCIFFSGICFAVEPVSDPMEQLDSVETVKAKIGQINDQLTTLRAVKSDQVAQEFGVSTEDFDKRLIDLRMLRSAHERLLYSITALDGARKEMLAVKERYENDQTMGRYKNGPYTLTFLDTVQEELSNVERNQLNIDLTVDVIKRELVADNGRLQAFEKEKRRIDETLSGKGPEGQTTLKWRSDTLGIQLREIQVIIRAKENEIKRYDTETKLATLQLAFLKEQVGVINANLAFDPEDLSSQLNIIMEKRAEIQKETERLRSEQDGVEKKWLAAQRGFEKAESADEKAVADSYLKSREEWKTTYQVALELNERTMLLMDHQAAAWQKRYAMVKGKRPLEELKSLREATKTSMENISRTLQIQQNYMVNLQNQMAAIEAKLEDNTVSPAIRQNLAVQLTAARKRLERRLSYQSVILATDNIEKRLLNEIENRMGQSTIQDHLAGIKKDLFDFWNIEIWTVDDQSVTLRKLAVALLILMLGMASAKYSLSVVRTRFLFKSQLKETTASAVHKLLSYAAYLLVFLFALRMVNIPLTAFAFLGGAVAIGMGFGAQNLINNFISGFMILGERPINIGDLIEVDSVLGMVEEIGARCTRIRTGENIHILVPNSTFLEKNIVNWTHSDKKIRTNVTVGVSYGSAVKTVQEKLIQAVSEAPKVLKYPQPFVLFSEFGDNALIFNVYFWVEIRRVIERREIESTVRFKIAQLFSEAGLVIAFPQRDIHLDTLKPLQINIAHGNEK
ncbi:mechanosensitive ion channel domain-containing protein [uncultured Desulfobacter sp.]|uniref:mechanosensitive ion channel domain-containing protein n=1 Tax=uncultured Desulfobacter sp. TaxID=240139 RepID=UPI002AAACB9B|nr:mechanosensitive ion channel domain-containing protein [uncultured Desulfobacter sp.]